MDCEKFDQYVIDALYDELDEVTFAALKRHVEGCPSCATTWAKLRATREVGVLPIEAAPDDLEDRILDAVALAERSAPLPKRLLRGLAWAGSHAMRPQFAMAALFFLVIGSSLLLLRPHGSFDHAEHVVAAAKPDGDFAKSQQRVAATALAALPSAAPEAVAAAAPSLASPAFADEGRGAVAKGASGATAAPAATAPSGDDARSALADARATRDASGCAAAIPKFDALAASFPGTQAAADAMWDEAQCYKKTGDGARAESLFLALRSTGYRDRAGQELDGAKAKNNQQNVVALRSPAAAPPPPAKPPPSSVNGGMNPRAPAAPRKTDAAGF